MSEGGSEEVDSIIVEVRRGTEEVGRVIMEIRVGREEVEKSGPWYIASGDIKLYRYCRK